MTQTLLCHYNYKSCIPYVCERLRTVPAVRRKFASEEEQYRDVVRLSSQDGVNVARFLESTLKITCNPRKYQPQMCRKEEQMNVNIYRAQLTLPEANQCKFSMIYMRL